MSNEVEEVHRSIAQNHAAEIEELRRCGFTAPGDGGREHHNRGKGKEGAYHELALEFIQQWKAGSELVGPPVEADMPVKANTPAPAPFWPPAWPG